MATNAKTPPKASNKLDLDDFICKIFNVGSPGRSLTKAITEEEIIQLCQLACEVFKSQSMMIELEAPIKICGDTHGQFSDLMRLFDRTGFPPCVNYLFLGDYVDRGRQSLELICLLFCYKVKYPQNFFMLRGNHESSSINLVYGFYNECIRRYNSIRLWYAFQDTFSWMPLSALVGGRILCMHGGLSPDLHDLDQLRDLPRPTDAPSPNMSVDLLWADPDANTKSWRPSPRGVSYMFGADVVIHACSILDVDLIARGHQVVQDGYEFFANRHMVTIFSAPHYCGEFNNSAGAMVVDKNLACSFVVYRPITRSPRVTMKNQQEKEYIPNQ